MATGNTPKPRRPHSKPAGSIEERLAPLAAAMPEAPTGRVRALEEARRALRIPTSAETEILQLWGVPKDFQLVVYPVAEPALPDRVAEFALLRVIQRSGRELVAGEGQTPLRVKDVSNSLWVVYGSIAVATDGSLVLESLGIGPAFDGQLSRTGDDIAHGITSPFLRLLSPPRILAACAEQLLIQRHQLDELARAGAKPMAARQRDLLDRIDEGRPMHAHVSETSAGPLRRAIPRALPQGRTQTAPPARRQLASPRPGPRPHQPGPQTRLPHRRQTRPRRSGPRPTPSRTRLASRTRTMRLSSI